MCSLLGRWETRSKISVRFVLLLSQALGVVGLYNSIWNGERLYCFTGIVTLEYFVAQCQDRDTHD